MARSTARRRALNTLYEADEKGQDILSLLSERIAMPGAQTPLPDYAIEIVRGVAEHRREIDHTLDAHSTGWKVRRMGVVDRNILRIAAWEILFNDDVPDRVAIDEALSLARTLCDDNALPFIQGLLSAVCEAKDAAAQNESDESNETVEAAEVAEAADSAEVVNGGDTEQDATGSATESADSAAEPVSDSDFVAESFVDSDAEVSAEEEAPAEAAAEANDGETAATSEDSSSATGTTDINEEDSSSSEQSGESVESA